MRHFEQRSSSSTNSELLPAHLHTDWFDLDQDSGIYFAMISAERYFELGVDKFDQDMWDANDYGSLESAGYISRIRSGQGRHFGAFRDGKPVGSTTIFAGPAIMPFQQEIFFEDQADLTDVQSLADGGVIEEVGIATVSPEIPSDINAALGLWRLCLRDAIQRNVRAWGMIMEPQRAKAMNWRYGLTFEAVGQPVRYQGGECTSNIMVFDEMIASMERRRPRCWQFVCRDLLRQDIDLEIQVSA